MKVMVMVKATADSEAGVMPTAQLLADMGRFNQSLIEAGVLLAAEGLKPSRYGKRVRFNGKIRMVTDGPFAETKEYLGGFWVIKAEDLDAALGWAAKGSAACGGPVEVRPFQEDVE